MLQGFSASIQVPCDPPLTTKELIDLAGNAFNGAVCCALVLAIFGSADWHRLMALSLHFESGGELSEDEVLSDNEGGRVGEEGGESEAASGDDVVSAEPSACDEDVDGDLSGFD